MIEFPLAIRPTTVAAKPDAWLIPGGTAGIWLDEISRWGVAMDRFRLAVLPTSLSDRTPAALLVTQVDSLDRRLVQRALPYAQLGKRLFVPAEAVLEPPVADRDLQSGLVWPLQVLHPSIGLVGFRESDFIRVEDLLRAPPVRETSWNHAAAGLTLNDRLRSVSPDAQSSITIILEEGRDDIGSESTENLPPDESESKLNKGIAKALTPAMKALSKLKVPGVPASMTPGFVQKLSDWAADHVLRWSKSLLDDRLKELQRLQNLFESDPDAALRHALPLTGNGGRGVAPPSSKLGSRNIDFNAARLGRSGRVDNWHIPDDTRKTLLAKYRAAAMREMQLGRYRRAAYIFAELLGDRTAAASALREGKFFREAAALYRELHDNTSAAKCLEDGGLLNEAVELHVELRNFEKAGDLSRILQREEDAEHYYRLAVQALLTRDARIPAAKLLETKLNVPDEALELLTTGWPLSSSAMQCLSESFRLLSDLGRHPETKHRIESLRATTLPTNHADWATQVLSTLAGNYPNHDVRAVAADATRVIAGKALANVTGTAASKPFVDAVTRLAPQDRLLQRDGARFLERRSIPPAKPSRPKVISSAKEPPRLVRAFRLPPESTWDAATAAGEFFYATGTSGPKTAALLQGTFDGTFRVTPWPYGPLPAERLIDAGHGAPAVFVASLSNRAAVGIATIPELEEFRSPARFWVPAIQPGRELTGVCHDDSGQPYISHVDDGELSITTFSPTFKIAATYAVTAFDSDSHSNESRIPIAVRGDSIFIARGAKLAQLSTADKPNELTLVRLIDLPHPARGIVATPPFVRVRIAVTLAEGGLLVWADGTTHPFAHGMFDPLATFTRGGALVAINSTVCRVYDTSDGKLALKSSFHFDGPAPIAVMPTNKLNEFAFLATNGGMRVFEIPE